MWAAIAQMAGVILLFIGLYTIPIFPLVLGAGFLIWCFKH